jgi:hypothetical protein
VLLVELVMQLDGDPDTGQKNANHNQGYPIKTIVCDGYPICADNEDDTDDDADGQAVPQGAVSVLRSFLIRWGHSPSLPPKVVENPSLRHHFQLGMSVAGRP